MPAVRAFLQWRFSRPDGPMRCLWTRDRHALRPTLMIIAITLALATVAGDLSRQPAAPPPPAVEHYRLAEDQVVEYRYRCGRRSSRFLLRYSQNRRLIGVDAVRSGRRPPQQSLQHLLEGLQGSVIRDVSPACFRNSDLLILIISRGDRLSEAYIHWDARGIGLQLP